MDKYNEMQLETNIQEDGQYNVQVKIKSKETEEIDILLSGIKSLIDYIGVESLCEGDEKKYHETLKKVIYTVADNIGFTTGAYIEKLEATIQYDKRTGEPSVDEASRKAIIIDYLNGDI
jgi:hypothetical protein